MSEISLQLVMHIEQKSREASILVADRTDRELWAEVAIVLLVGLIPLYLPAIDLISGNTGNALLGDHFSLRESLRNTILDTTSAVLLLYLIWRSGEPWARFGFNRSRSMILDATVILGILLMNFAIEELILFLDSDHLEENESIGAPATANIAQYVLFLVHLYISAFYEELLMRGYLIPRFEQLLKSTWVSLSLTALLFGGFHMDQGVAGVLSTTLTGLVYGGAFCWFRRLWPVVTAHTLYNLTVMLLPD